MRGLRLWNVKKLAAVLVVVTGLVGWVAVSREANKDGVVTNQQAAALTAGATSQDLATVSRSKVFFGHQSVGMNILDGVQGLYAARGMASPTIEQDGTAPGPQGGFIDHTFVGENEKPLLKIQDFEAKLRSGVGRQVDVAMMKFCYVDVNSSTNVDELFATYRKTMADLQRDFPDVTFVHATVPLTTDQGLLSRIKAWVTGNGQSAAADNVARDRLNELLRHEYAGNHLFDIALIESTEPDGGRANGTYEGRQYYRLYDGYAADNGHLNGVGAQAAAAGWLKALAQAAAK